MGLQSSEGAGRVEFGTVGVLGRERSFLVHSCVLQGWHVAQNSTVPETPRPAPCGLVPDPVPSQLRPALQPLPSWML